MSDQENEGKDGATSKRTRSPNFPLISLERALERTKQLHDRDKTHSVPISVLYERWNYKPNSSTVLQIVAAVKAYGLVEATGSGDKRELKVSETARKIFLGHQDTGELIKQCALTPKVFEHLWEKYKIDGLPGDDLIRYYLLFDYAPKFNEDSVDTCVACFRDTIVFAKLDQSDIMEPEDLVDLDAGADGQGTGQKPPAYPKRANTMTQNFEVGDCSLRLVIENFPEEDTKKELIGKWFDLIKASLGIEEKGATKGNQG